MNRPILSILSMVAAIAIVTLGCAAGDESSGPTVAAPALGGVYMLDTLDVEGSQAEVSDPVEFIIESEFGELRVETACGALLGSFSLLADGQAGFTIAGGSTRDCSDGAMDQQNELVAALGRINSWSTSGSDLDLRSPSADRVLLDR